jgi:uncharacterized protein (TIGR01319 family)
MQIDPNKLQRVLVTDCGSTTTKALLFEKKPEGWRFSARGEAPTTVEEPVADVTVGALNAFSELEQLRQIQILKSFGDLSYPFISERSESQGLDLYLSTSSAGGGLQMLVAGVVQSMSAQSATRAALGAGAIVLETLSADDGLEDHERIARIRDLRPDIVLLAGGVDGGSVSHAIELAELIRAANPKPRFGNSLKLPVIYAGNRNAIADVQEILSKTCSVKVVENLRPNLERENLGPAREAIHEFFLSHVMSHSPGYSKLLSWSPVPVMPTPAAVGNVIKSLAESRGINVLCADIGGATTDLFSVFHNSSGQPVFNRTVSANYGMSYSVANVLIGAGVENIRRWLPFAIDTGEIKDRLRNKMIRPTSIPQTQKDLLLEHAVCREALRLSLAHHKQLAVGLSGEKKSRSISDIFSQSGSDKTLFKTEALDLVIGSGGVLSHSPSRLQAALMMLDGFSLWGCVELAVDSIFMLPHLGVLASVHPDAATEILINDCLIPICHALVPKYSNKLAAGSIVAHVFIDDQEIASIKAGSIDHIKKDRLKDGLVRIVPQSRKVDCGAGPGMTLTKQIKFNSEGMILDGRNRTHTFFAFEPSQQIQAVKQSLDSLQIGISDEA